jgi:hypothetical protein
MDSQLMRAGVDIAQMRDRFVLSMGALEHEIGRTFDWREWVRRKPLAAMALAVGLGIYLGRRH